MAGEQEDESKELAGCHSATHARRRTVDCFRSGPPTCSPTLAKPDDLHVGDTV